jgi:hypothetical protein
MRSFSRKKTNTKRKRIEKEVEDPGGAVSPAARKRRQSVQSPEVQEKTNKLYERQQYDEMVAKACLLKRVKDSYKEKLRDAIHNRVDSCSKSIVKASSGLMHLAREMYRNVTHMETVEIPDEFFDKTSTRQLMFGTGETRRENERVHALHEKLPFYSLEGTRYKGDSRICTYGAMKYITNLKNHLTLNLERFMIRAVFALYPVFSRNAIWAMINGIKNNGQHEDEIEFVDKKVSNENTSEASVIRALFQEDRLVLGLANPAEKISELKKYKERYFRLILPYFVFLDRELKRKAEMMRDEEENEEWERRKAALMGKRFNVVPLCNVKSHFVTINSSVLHGPLKEISPEFDIREEFSKVTSRGADFRAFREFMETQAAHDEEMWKEYSKPRWARLRMNLYSGKQRAFAKFFNQLSTLQEDKTQRLVVAYGAGRWVTQKGCTPAPTTRTYKEWARRFVTIPIDMFRTSYKHHELGYTLERVEMEKCQRIPEDMKTYGALTVEQMERRARLRGLLALVSTTNDGKKRMEFVNRDFNAAVNIRRCAVLETRPPELTWENFVGEPLKVD